MSRYFIFLFAMHFVFHHLLIHYLLRVVKNEQSLAVITRDVSHEGAFSFSHALKDTANHDQKPTTASTRVSYNSLVEHLDQ